MVALLKALEIAGAEVVDVCIAIQRGDPDIGRPYKSLVKIEVTGKRCVWLNDISERVKRLKQRGGTEGGPPVPRRAETTGSGVCHSAQGCRF